MTRKECLDKAAGCVLRDRNNEYGEPEQSFNYIADLWSAYLRTKIEPYDAAAMMALFKLARLRFNPYYEDGWADLAGYAACGAELAGKAEAYKEFIKKCGEEYKKLRAESEAKDEAEEEPKFKPGDRVQFRDEIPSTSEPHWFEGVYVERLSTGGHAVKFGPHGHVIHCSDKEIRAAPKAEDEPKFEPGDHLILTYPNGEGRPCVYVGESIGETAFCLVRYDDDGTTDDVPVDELRRVPRRAEGCEALVFDEGRMRESMPGIVPQDGPSDFDAPQAKEALFRHIVDCNPATFKPRTPTGEELAEMAEEDAHE